MIRNLVKIKFRLNLKKWRSIKICLNCRKSEDWIKFKKLIRNLIINKIIIEIKIIKEIIQEEILDQIILISIVEEIIFLEKTKDIEINLISIIWIYEILLFI